jgi:carbon monoxide dehydrogenase subunit G
MAHRSADARRDGGWQNGRVRIREEATMSVNVPIELGYAFEVRAKYDEVFALLADVPRSVSHFPHVQKLTNLGDGVYKWEMQKVGTAQIHLQTVYASRYAGDKARGTVTWTPVQGVGNALVGGGWQITDNKGQSTKCVLRIRGTVDVPLPGVMKPVVGPLVEGEFEKLVEKYIDNLIAVFGGEVA